MPFVDPEEGFSGGLWPRGYRAVGARYPRKRSPWNSAIKSWNGQEVICITEILTPKESNGCGCGPPEDWSGRIYG